MELKLSKVYVPTNSEFKNGTVGLEFTEKEGYFLTKEELERVIGDACLEILKRRNGLESGLLPNTELVKDLLTEILK